MMPSHLAIVTTEVVMFAIVLALIVASIRLLVKIRRKAPGYLDAVTSNRLGDAICVVGGVALLALMISDRFSGWGWLDYLFSGLVLLLVLLSITSTTLINRALDRSERKHHDSE